MTAQLVLVQHPSVGHRVPLTSTVRGYRAEVTIQIREIIADLLDV